MKSRKNKKMLVAVAMILMIALVAGMGAMTYSRYITTSTTNSPTATAAKWNYVINANATNLFGAAYKEGNADTVATLTETGDVVVRAASTAKVVAPGTSGSMTITVDGESEVLAKFTVSIAATKEIHFDTYYPIKWKFNGGTYKDIEELNGALSALEAKATWDNEDEVFKFSTTYTISWEWAFESGADDAAKAATNARDTLIGLKAVNTAETAWTAIKDVKCATGVTYADFTDQGKYEAIETEMSFALTATIEQVQA